MRSPIGPILVLLGLATAVVLVLVLLQTMSLRDELRQARDDVTLLQSQVDGSQTVTTDELHRALEELETSLRESLASGGLDGDGGADPGQPAGGSASAEDILERIDDVLARVTALDERVDEICDGVPVC